MKEIINKPWDYRFFEKNSKFYLSVMCGSIGVFEINIELSEEECFLYEKSGVGFIDELAKNIQLNPSKFSERNCGNVLSC